MRFSFVRGKKVFDLVLLRGLPGVEGEVGIAVVVVVVVVVVLRSAADWESFMEAVGVELEDVVVVSGSGRGGGGETLLRG